MKILNDYMRIKARPKGNMTEGFAMDDMSEFCIKYMMRFTLPLGRYGIRRNTNPYMVKSWRCPGRQNQCHSSFGSRHMTSC
jgi:hypothetical protein